MDTKTIKKRIKKIEEKQWDHEAAHGMEDDLYIDFIKYIAKQKGEYAKEARAVLRVKKLDFGRYCA